jgi:prophage regulatory protein
MRGAGLPAWAARPTRKRANGASPRAGLISGKTFSLFFRRHVMQVVLRLPAVLTTVGLSRSTVYEKIKRGEFPRPFKLGERAIGWREGDIAAWIAARVASSNGGEER